MALVLDHINGRVERPPYEQLPAEIEASSWSAVGRTNGVSDNAVREWVRAYERERADTGDGSGAPVAGCGGPLRGGEA
jgi:hypothetical protein